MTQTVTLPVVELEASPGADHSPRRALRTAALTVVVLAVGAGLTAGGVRLALRATRDSALGRGWAVVADGVAATRVAPVPGLVPGGAPVRVVLEVVTLAEDPYQVTGAQVDAAALPGCPASAWILGPLPDKLPRVQPGAVADVVFTLALAADAPAACRVPVPPVAVVRVPGLDPSTEPAPTAVRPGLPITVQGHLEEWAPATSTPGRG